MALYDLIREGKIIQGDKFSLFIKEVKNEISYETIMVIAKGLLKLKPKAFQKDIKFLKKYIYDLLSSNFHVFIIIMDGVLLDMKIVEEGFLYRGLKVKARKDFPDLSNSELERETELITGDLKSAFDEVRKNINDILSNP